MLLLGGFCNIAQEGRLTRSCFARKKERPACKAYYLQGFLEFRIVEVEIHAKSEDKEHSPESDRAE